MRRQAVLFDGGGNLWTTNGTANGTHEVEIVNSNFIPENPYGITGFDGKALFGASFPFSGGPVLWSTSGSGAEFLTVIGEGVNPLGHVDFSPSYLTVSGNEVLFSGADSVFYNGLWVSDGTGAGTHELKGIANANASGGVEPTDITSFLGEALFNGVDTAGDHSLWESDGTVTGTQELAPVIGAAASGLDPKNLSPLVEVLAGPGGIPIFENAVWFNGADAGGGRGLWETDGSAANTQEVTGIVGASATGLNPSDITQLPDGAILLAGTDASGAVGLWEATGINASPVELTAISGADPVGLRPSNLTVLNGVALFSGADASGQFGLWITDGSAAGTHELTGIAGAAATGLDPTDLTAFNGQMLFNGAGADGQIGLWTTDGTVQGTHELSGISGAPSNGLNPSNMAAVALNVPPPDDFNGDGLSDILSENASTGQVTIGAVNVNDRSGDTVNPGPSGPRWEAATSMATGMPTSCGRTPARARSRSGTWTGIPGSAAVR